MCYYRHIQQAGPFGAARLALPGPPFHIKQGRGSSRAQAVSQKTRKKSVSKSPKASSKVTLKKAAAAGRGATKGRAQPSAKDSRAAVKDVAAKSPRAKAVVAKPVTGKSVNVKSSKNKRSAMPNKTAKPAAKVAPKVAEKPAAKPVAAKAPVAAVKAPVAAKAAPKEAVKAVAKPATAAPRTEEPKKVLTQRQGFKTGEFVVYPAHGVGQILAIEEQEIAGAKLELFVINFMKDKMTLRVPTAKVANVGMRKLSEPALVKRALETLKGRARIKRTMWSRRAQEYEAKINSGDIVAIAEVVRDLFRSDSQPEQSYSERQLYEAALDRLSREIAVVQHVTETEAVKEIEGQLAKSPRRGAKAEAGAEAGADDADSDGDDAAVADEAA
ncbi:MAG: CarD family transcriptional regulator [Tardiphaga sp.]|nr:CarD family transcriptional regulator [Tardiphaga sp.]